GSFKTDADLPVEVAGMGHVGGGDTEAEHFPAVDPTPSKGARGQRHLCGVRSVENVSEIAEFLQNVGNGGGMPERIDVVAHVRAHAKPILKVLLPAQNLAPPAHESGEIGVGLE